MTSNLPKTYWAKAVNTASFISNLLPTASRGNISPFELWTGCPPPLSCLQAFGCLAYISVCKGHRSWVFGNTGEMGILVGYENDGTTYQIIRLSDMKLVPTQHACFSELVFPGFSQPSLVNEELDFIDDDFFDCIPASKNQSPVPASDPEDDALLADLPAPEVYVSSSPPAEFVTPPLTPLPAVEARPRRRIIRDVCPANIIQGSRRPRAFVMQADDNVPAHYHQAINSPNSVC
jgi:hypothetical protein